MCEVFGMRYAFHEHESDLDLADVVAFEPELCSLVARLQGEPNVEDAVAVVLDLFGANYVREQTTHLETIGKNWVYLARRARSHDERARVAAIAERLAWRFDAVWRDGRATLHLVLRSVALRTGCAFEDAPLHVDELDIGRLLKELGRGLRAGYASSVDAAFAVELLERAGAPALEPVPSTAADVDWAAEISIP